MSTLEVPTSGVDISLKTFPKHPTVPAIFFDRTNRWQAPFVAEVKAVGLGCGLWTALCLGDFESLTFTPGKGRGRGAKGGRGKGGSCRMNFPDELSVAVMGKWNTSLCEAVGKRLAQLQNLLMLSWKSGLFTLTHATTSKVLCLDRASKIEQLSFAEVDRKTMAHQRRSSRCGPLERKAKLEWHHTCHHDAKLGFEIQLFVASLVYHFPST